VAASVGENSINSAWPACAKMLALWSMPPPAVPMSRSHSMQSLAKSVGGRLVTPTAQSKARAEATTRAEEELRPAAGGMLPCTIRTMPSSALADW
jgi:hypothetical protein